MQVKLNCADPDSGIAGMAIPANRLDIGNWAEGHAPVADVHVTAAAGSQVIPLTGTSLTTLPAGAGSGPALATVIVYCTDCPETTVDCALVLLTLRADCVLVRLTELLLLAGVGSDQPDGSTAVAVLVMVPVNVVA